VGVRRKRGADRKPGSPEGNGNGKARAESGQESEQESETGAADALDTQQHARPPATAVEKFAQSALELCDRLEWAEKRLTSGLTDRQAARALGKEYDLSTAHAHRYVKVVKTRWLQEASFLTREEGKAEALVWVREAYQQAQRKAKRVQVYEDGERHDTYVADPDVGGMLGAAKLLSELTGVRDPMPKEVQARSEVADSEAVLAAAQVVLEQGEGSNEAVH